MTYQAPPGVFDIIPQDLKNPWKNSKAWAHVECIMSELAKVYGYSEIRTPIFEKTDLFKRGVGEETDIVSKEMYTFQDRGDRSLTLRPEGTAPVVRALIENSLLAKRELKVFYLGPMFRYERMQAGRFRQFNQFGIEAFGRAEPEQDAEVIALSYEIFKKLGIKGLKVKLSSLGDLEARRRFKEDLVTFLKQHLEGLSEDSKRRVETNPLRVLDSKDEGDRKILKSAPSLHDHLSPESLAHFEKVQALLKALNIPFEIDDCLVRGLDYYESTVFEIVSEDLGAQNALGGGGRYDGLLEQLGGERLPSIGFALGVERTLQVMLKQGVLDTSPQGLELYLIPMGEEAVKKAFTLIHALREMGIACDLRLAQSKVGKGFSRADELGARYAAALGERELESNTLELKKLSSGEKTEVSFQELSTFLKITKENHV
ncbi:MAG: histidine--tRNA ligase [Chlamydiia bacterium]|nr:histidine--tRNA ligase [Chlamydiia bacterium]